MRVGARVCVCACVWMGFGVCACVYMCVCVYVWVGVGGCMGVVHHMPCARHRPTASSMDMPLSRTSVMILIRSVSLIVISEAYPEPKPTPAPTTAARNTSARRQHSVSTWSVSVSKGAHGSALDR